MVLSKIESELRTNAAEHIYLLEALLYVGVAILLTVAAGFAMTEAAAILWRGITHHMPANDGLMVLDQLLFVLMLIEILHTVRMSIHSKELMLAEPFLIVALIASIRRILVITLQAAKLTEGKSGDGGSGNALPQQHDRTRTAWNPGGPLRVLHLLVATAQVTPRTTLDGINPARSTEARPGALWPRLTMAAAEPDVHLRPDFPPGRLVHESIALRPHIRPAGACHYPATMDSNPMTGSRIDVLKNMVAQNPGDSFSRYGLAMEYANAGNLEQAITEYKTLLSGNPKYAAGYYHAGQAFEKLGRLDDARAMYRKGIEITTQIGDLHTCSELQAALDILGE